MGADHVINPKGIDFKAEVQRILNGQLADVAVEAVGIGPTVAQAIDALRPKGICVWIGNSAKRIEFDMQAVVTQELTILGTYIYTDAEFGEAIDFMSRHRLPVTQLVSECVSLDQAAALFESLAVDADRHLKTVVVSSEPDSYEDEPDKLSLRAEK